MNIFKSVFPFLIIAIIFVACEEDPQILNEPDLPVFSVTDTLAGDYYGWHTLYLESYGTTTSLDSFYNDTLRISKISSDTIAVDFFESSNPAHLAMDSMLTSLDSVVFTYEISNYASSHEKKLIYDRSAQTITYIIETANWSISGPDYNLSRETFYQN